MDIRINLRGTMNTLEIGESMEVDRKPYVPDGFAPDYVRALATRLGDNEGKIFTVSARKGVPMITVTRIS